ncbi:MAG: hypothetical protein EA411_02960 [Saprospirales bacterium]|nr:MAG: hypothetical protein EA411_02960 [Saprospirales bacterium]
MPEFDHYLFGKKRAEKELFGRCVVKSHAFSAWRLSNLITLVFINPSRNVMRQFIIAVILISWSLFLRESNLEKISRDFGRGFQKSSNEPY